MISEMPLGQLPVLEFNGEVLSQSMTIARFLAKEYGLAGKTNIEQAQADMVVDTASDLVTGTVSIQISVKQIMVVNLQVKQKISRTFS